MSASPESYPLLESIDYPADLRRLPTAKLTELAEELRKVRPRERIARALRQAADIIDPQTPVR